MHGILNLRPKEADQLSSPSVLHVFTLTTSTTPPSPPSPHNSILARRLRLRLIPNQVLRDASFLSHGDDLSPRPALSIATLRCLLEEPYSTL